MSSSSGESQFFSFLWTKLHFSSSWIFLVEGGKAHEFVVSRPGLVAGLTPQPHDGALVDLDQPAGLSDAAALLQMLQHGGGLVGGQVAVEQGGAFAFGEASLTGLAPQQAARLGWPV